MKLTKKHIIAPPQKPSQVFLGDIFGNKSLFPQFFPNRYAKLLFTQIRRYILIEIPFSNEESREDVAIMKYPEVTR